MDLLLYIVMPVVAVVLAVVGLWKSSRSKKQERNTDEGVTLLNLSPANDKWNKMALGIEDVDVPSRKK
ncbi:MAG: hypothetical protein HYT68_02175 [Candidatus Zambryskibacteria bacterium]|nr:hypothetical protein [Candidatus Zambryskibacteria bacterium]